MEQFATDNLILLEFLVENVILEYGTQQSLGSMTGDTCVSFQFLDNTAIYVCEEDFAPRKCPSDPCGKREPATKNGKSCLFAMSPQQAESCLRQFDVYVSLFRKMKPGTLPEKISIGETLISIVSLYNEVVKAARQSNGDSPVAKTLKDHFSIQNTSGEMVGHIGVYIRMSCFGKLIVTQFQMNLQDKSVEFKAKEGHYLFKYNKKDGRCPAGLCPGSNDSKTGCGCGGPPCPNQSPKCCPPGGGPPPIKCPPPPAGSTLAPCCQTPPCPGPPPVSSCPYVQPCPSLPPCCTPTPCPSKHPCCVPAPCPPPPCRVPPPCSPPPCRVPPPCSPPQCCTPAPCSSSPCCAPAPCPPPPCCVPAPCPPPSCCVPAPCSPCIPCQPPPCSQCSVPPCPPPCPPPDPPGEYQEIGAEMGGNRLLIRVHKESQQVEVGDCNEGCFCNPPLPPPPAPGSCCDPNSPFCLKVGANTQAANNICVTPPACAATGGAKPAELNDPNREMFILRIGKKSQKANKKNNLELELCTPKAKEIKPAPKMVTQDTQCLDGDFPNKPKAGKPGGKGKGKGKGKKGKK